MTNDSPLDYAEPLAASTLKRDVISAYIAAAMRIVAWVIVMGIVYRAAGAEHFAMLLLIRGTIGILNYTSAGLSPAMIHFLAKADRPGALFNRRIIYSNGLVLAGASLVVGLLGAFAYAAFFNRHVSVTSAALLRQTPWAVVLIGLAALVKLASDAPAASLQTRHRIALDNALLAGADALWAVLMIALFHYASLLTAAATYAFAYVLLLVGRTYCAGRTERQMWPPRWEFIDRTIIRQLLAFGGLVLLSQMAEYFYAPTDYILINHFFGPKELAAYGPGVQIDMGLLMLVMALAGVLLPHSAMAHAAFNHARLRRFYIIGTLASLGLLILAASAIWALLPVLFYLWFGKNPPDTRAILPLILASTIIGGSSNVGRSILLGMGKVKPYTFASIIAGVVNAGASYCFVRFGKMGLPGILYGTLVAVIGRCAVWMPWYVLRTLRMSENKEARAHEAPGPMVPDNLH